MAENKIIDFKDYEYQQAGLLWSVLYSIRSGVSTDKIKIHNRILEKMEQIFNVDVETEPIYDILEMRKDTLVLIIHQLKADELKKPGDFNLELTKPEFLYMQGILNHHQWLPAQSRLAENLLDKFEIVI